MYTSCGENDFAIEYIDSQLKEKQKSVLTMGAILLYDTIWKMSTGWKHPVDILLWKKEKYEKRRVSPL